MPKAIKATPGMEPFVLLAFSVQRLARAVRSLVEVENGERGAVINNLCRVADADAMLVLEWSGIDLPPGMKQVATDRRREREKA